MTWSFYGENLVMLMKYLLILGVFAVHASAQRVVLTRAQIFGAPSQGWQAAIGGAGVSPLAAVLEARGLSPETFVSLKPDARGAAVASARVEAVRIVRAEARAAMAAPGNQAAIFDQALRLSVLSGRLSSYLDLESAHEVERTRGALLSAMGESERARLRERIEAETWEWSSREAVGVSAVRGGEGRAAMSARLDRPTQGGLRRARAVETPASSRSTDAGATVTGGLIKEFMDSRWGLPVFMAAAWLIGIAFPIVGVIGIGLAVGHIAGYQLFGKKKAPVRVGGALAPDWMKPERLSFALAHRSGDETFVILRDGARYEAMFRRSSAEANDGLSVRFVRRERPPMGPEEHVDVVITRDNAAGAAELLENTLKKYPVEGPQGEVAEEMLRSLRSLGRTAGGR